MKDKITVIVTLYNRLEYARNMILALQQQTKQIDELIFADDGSSEKLMEYIEDLLVDCNFKIKHVYQDDIGFRLARSRNNGAREASGDYLIFLDQDVIFDNDFIESIYNSRRKKRMIFSEALGSSLEEKNKIQELINTQKFDYKEIYDLVDNTKKVEQDQIVNKEKFYNFLYKLKLRSRGAKIVGLIFSLFKEDFININGLDEKYIGYGYEDDDFGNRLTVAGINGKELVTKNIQLHLWHYSDPTKIHSANEEYYYKRKEKIFSKKDLYFFDVDTGENNIKFASLCDLLDFYYLDIAKSNINKSTEKRLFDFIKTKLNRLSKKLEILNKELIEAESKEDYKLKGQLLISNIYMFKKSVPEVATLQNFYSEELEDIKIELDPNLTIEKNSDRYFNLYKKNKRTIENLYEQIKITEEDIVYFETLQFQVENADKSDLIEIKEELINSGLLKEKVSNSKKKNKNNYFVINYNGIDIYVGKNNIQNDAITNKLARRDYLWFHAKDIPGSHVVIFNNAPDEKTKEVAAMLAGYFSKFKNEDRVAVDMTLIKNVKKVSGAKPGMVTYTGQKTIKQKIDKMFINELINDKSL